MPENIIDDKELSYPINVGQIKLLIDYQLDLPEKEALLKWLKSDIEDTKEFIKGK